MLLFRCLTTIFFCYFTCLRGIVLCCFVVHCLYIFCALTFFHYFTIICLHNLTPQTTTFQPTPPFCFPLHHVHVYHVHVYVFCDIFTFPPVFLKITPKNPKIVPPMGSSFLNLCFAHKIYIL